MLTSTRPHESSAATSDRALGTCVRPRGNPLEIGSLPARSPSRTDSEPAARRLASLFEDEWLPPQTANSSVSEAVQWGTYATATAGLSEPKAPQGCMSKMRGPRLSLRSFDRRASSVLDGISRVARAVDDGGTFVDSMRGYFDLTVFDPELPLTKPKVLPTYLRPVAKDLADLEAVLTRKRATYPQNAGAMTKTRETVNEAFGLCVLAHKLERGAEHIERMVRELGDLRGHATRLETIEKRLHPHAAPLYLGWQPTDADLRLATYLERTHEVDLPDPSRPSVVTRRRVAVRLLDRIARLRQLASVASARHSQGLPSDLIRRLQQASSRLDQASAAMNKAASEAAGQIATLNDALVHYKADDQYARLYALYGSIREHLDTLSRDGISQAAGLLYPESHVWTVKEGVVAKTLNEPYEALCREVQEVRSELERVRRSERQIDRLDHERLLTAELSTFAQRLDVLVSTLTAGLKLRAAVLNASSWADAGQREVPSDLLTREECKLLQASNELNLDAHRSSIIKDLADFTDVYQKQLELVGKVWSDESLRKSRPDVFARHLRDFIKALETLQCYMALVTQITSRTPRLSHDEVDTAVTSGARGTAAASQPAIGTYGAAWNAAAEAIRQGEELRSRLEQKGFFRR